MTRMSKRTRITGAVTAAAVVAGLLIFATTQKSNVTNLVTLHCGVSHFDQVDPIVSPGVKPSAHEHTFYGNDGTDQNSTPSSLLGGSTTCSTKGDTAAYWVPTLYVDGVRVSAKQLHVGEYWFANNAVAETPPFGMEYVAGDSHATSLSEESDVRWHCRNGKQIGDGTSPLACDTSTGPLKYEVFFPQCWDGVGTAPVDFSYAVDGIQGDTCAVGLHHIAQLGLQVDLVDSKGKALYDPFNADGSLRIAFSSGPYYTAHADFLNAFDESVLTGIVQGCMDHQSGVACPDHA